MKKHEPCCWPPIETKFNIGGDGQRCATARLKHKVQNVARK
jgi:hypothetical protein